jgi:hypothetical protein
MGDDSGTFKNHFLGKHLFYGALWNMLEYQKADFVSAKSLLCISFSQLKTKRISAFPCVSGLIGTKFAAQVAAQSAAHYLRGGRNPVILTR